MFCRFEHSLNEFTFVALDFERKVALFVREPLVNVRRFKHSDPKTLAPLLAIEDAASNKSPLTGLPVEMSSPSKLRRQA